MKKLTGLILIAALTSTYPALALTIQTANASIRQSPDHGHLASNGSVGEYVRVWDDGLYDVRVQAAGMVMENIWPIMAFEVNGTNLEQVSVDTANYQEYAFTAYLREGVHVISAGFTNDGYNGAEDRNLLLQTISVIAPQGVGDPQVSNYAQWLDSAEARELDLVYETDDTIAEVRMDPATVKVVDQHGNPIGNATVTVNQVAQDFLFGANIFMFDRFTTAEENELYKQRFEDVFNYATLPFYWAVIEPAQNQIQWGSLDAMVQWCGARDIAMKAHSVLWGESALIPAWAGASPSLQIQLNHVDAVMQRYQNQIQNWEVVNEPFNAPGMDFESVQHHARNNYPAAQLVVNEYGNFYNGYPEFQNFLAEEQQYGVPFDTIGIQAHAPLETAFPIESVMVYLDQYAALGKDIHITEFTPPSNGSPVLGSEWRATWTEEEQADYADMFYRACFSHPAVKAISWWDVCDIDAWQPNGGLLRNDLSTKPAYDALKQLITEEWRTEANGSTQASGEYGFSGFHGQYSITVEVNGQTYESSAHLSEDGQNIFNVTVEVEEEQDTVAPVITRNGAAQVTVEAGQNYNDTGATATDDTDGNITANIVVSNPVNTNQTGTYQIHYDVSDAAGNAAQRVTRTVNVVDTQAPVITRNGAAQVTLETGQSYNDAGATATDSYDGNLTAQVNVNNPVNTAVPGSYTVTYTVSDAAGNAAAPVTRLVVVEQPEPQIIGIIGDADSNGVINDWDAALAGWVGTYGLSAVNNYLAGQGKPQVVDARLVDIDQDGQVNDWDGDLIRYILTYGVTVVDNYLASNGLPLTHLGETLTQ